MNWPCTAIELALTEAGIDDLLPDWVARQRRFLLAEDLRQMGEALPPIAPLKIGSDIGTLLGWSYVLEGSRLGARLILESVATSEDRTVRSATGFLRHGENIDLWRSFKTALSRIDDDAVAIGKACTAGIAGFECFIEASKTADRMI
jgi:heme oxygenase